MARRPPTKNTASFMTATDRFPDFPYMTDTGGGYVFDHLHSVGEGGPGAAHEIILAPRHRSGARFGSQNPLGNIYQVAQRILAATGELTIATPPELVMGESPIIQQMQQAGVATVERLRVLMDLPGGRGMIRAYAAPANTIIRAILGIANEIAPLSPDARNELLWGHRALHAAKQNFN